jgi:hypothetical protein
MPAKSNLPYKYCDDSALGAYFQGDTKRIRALQWLIAKSGKEHQLVTLSITIPYIGALLERSNSAHRSELVNRISALNEKEDLRLIDCDVRLARDAARMMNDAARRGWILHPVDALHLSAAELIRADSFLTYRLPELKQFEALFQLSHPVISEPYSDTLDYDPLPEGHP